MTRRRLLGGLAGAAVLLTTGGRSAEAATTKGVLGNLDDDASAWQIWVDPGDAEPGALLYDPPVNVPSPNRRGTALKLAITGGSRPYTHLHAYRKLPPAPTATAVEFSCRWRFSQTTLNNEGDPSVIQAIEPAINKWGRSRRYEWALQWENVGDGTAEAGTRPAWRLWNGSSWQDTGYTQRLQPDKWHKLVLRGDIVDGMVRYVQMISDDLTVSLGNIFEPVPAEGDNTLIPTFQLDGNYQQDPYSCLLDDVVVRWWKTSPWR